MKSLTNIWYKYKYLPCKKDNCIITNRLFWKELKDEVSNNSIYLAINTHSGAIDLFTQKEGKKIEESLKYNYWANLSDELFEKLVKRGYIFPSKEIEEYIFDTFIKDYKIRGYSTDKILASFALDMSCPMKCEYCFEKKLQEHGNKFEKSIMDKESLEKAFEFLNLMSKLQKREVTSVAGWGGEPLQSKNYEINKVFVDLANRNGYKISYFSNLAFEDDRYIKLLKENVNNMEFIQTTIDDIGEAHNETRSMKNAFEKTVANIDKLLKENLPVIVRTNIGEHNIDAIPRIAEFYEKKGWFDYPKFKGFITHVYDRHHDFTKKFTLSEDVAVSKFLEFRRKYPSVRKIQGNKFAPAVKNILEAFKLREETDIRKESFLVDIKPTITYCYTSNRAEYVFTGKPNFSIYSCAECTGMLDLKLAKYYPNFEVEEKQADLWGLEKGTINEVRTIDKLERCKKCKAATYCGGYCALEAINTVGTAYDVYCKHADEIIEKFLNNESQKLYERANQLMKNEEYITL